MLEASHAYAEAGPRVRTSRRRRDRRGQRARPVRARQPLAAALSDVGLDRRSDLGARRRRPAPCSSAGNRHRRDAGGRSRRRCRDAHTRGRAQPRRAARPHVVPRGRRPGREGHGDPSVQGPPSALLEVSPAAGDGIARQGEGPRRPRREPGDRGLRQQGLDRSARLRPAAPRRRAQFLRHVHRSAEGPRRPSRARRERT